MADTPQIQHSMLQSKFPVFLPEIPELKLSKDNFTAYIKSLNADDLSDMRKLSVRGAGKTGDDDAKVDQQSEKGPKSSFMDGLLSKEKVVPSFDEHDGKMLTENGDVAHETSGDPLVDLFYELEEHIDPSLLKQRLEDAWAADAAATLKIIWNARSIHLGKSNRHCFYRAVGWLYQKHPVTLLTNLQWLVRPVIQKKIPKQDDKVTSEDGEVLDVNDAGYDSDFVMVDGEAETPEAGESKKRKLFEVGSEDAEFDIKYGGAHGYWKDLLNVLVLAAGDELKVDGVPRNILNVERPNQRKCKRDWTEGKKKKRNEARHDETQERLRHDQRYKALHVSVARIFAEQLKLDQTRLESNEKSEIKKVTLAGKWAPSTKGMHDQHTTIVSSIAELLYPPDSVCPDIDPADRDLYLKHARNAYQVKTLSKLRKQLEVVERNITAKTFEQIKYDRVPSLAMKQYAYTFAKKDFDRFDKYIDNVAQGKAKISGAILLPSVMVAEVTRRDGMESRSQTATDLMVEQKLRDVADKAVSGQWASLVQRIKDSGTIESSIAVADVSGSMSYPHFPDGTVPMDSAVGLSLLIAEVTKPPFGGAFITFHSEPEVLRVGGENDKRSFGEKVKYMQSAPWGMNTDFAAVFEKLILPMAIKSKLRQEDMVKQVFVFSDMQFDAAIEGQYRWSTSYDRIRDEYKKHGYEMPKLIFWNLAAGRASPHSVGRASESAPKAVTAAEPGTAMVSGYSQGQLKMFLDNGQFKDAEDEESIETKDMGEDGEEIVKNVRKARGDSVAAMRKAISHDAYVMLKVVD